MVGLGLGSSLGAGFGFYALSWWGSLALFFLALALALWIAFPARLSGASLVSVCGLLALWGWSLISTRWAESADQALLDANRWLLYAAILVALIALVRGRGLERLLVACAIAPVIAIAAYLLARMAIGDGADLFLANRLNSPLEYVNGVAAYLLIGFWPMLAVAERTRSPALAGIGLAAASMLAGLIAMTQSRGAIAALVVSSVVILILVPGRVRRGWALIVVATAVGACASPLGDLFTTFGPGETLSDDLVAEVSRWIIVASVLAGALWALAASLLLPDPDDAGIAGRGAGVVLVTFAVIAAVVLGLSGSGRIDKLEEQYQSFTELRPAGVGDTRLATGGGNRYDYWRVAVDQFADAPLGGIGAGNYDTTYFQERRTTESIRNPHSIELQALGETGLVGFGALMVFLAAALTGLWSRARPGKGAYDPGLAVAAGGIFLAWFAQTSVDWLHLIPGLTGVALCAVAALVSPSSRAWRPSSARARRSASAMSALVVAVASLLIAMPLLADRLVSSGRDELADDPGAAVDNAREALSLNDESLAAYQLEAAGLARQGDYEASRAALLEATRREPSDYVTWALLGDIAVRRGDVKAARRYYGRSARLNPLEASLSKLPSDQRSSAQ